MAHKQFIALGGPTGPLAAALVLLVSGGLAVGGCLTVGDRIPSADALQARIEEELKPGASLAQIRAYLDSEGRDEGIEDGDTQISSAGQYSDLRDMGLPADTPIYQTIVRGELRGLDIFFVLDKDLRLQRVIVIEYHTGF